MSTRPTSAPTATRAWLAAGIATARWTDSSSRFAAACSYAVIACCHRYQPSRTAASPKRARSAIARVLPAVADLLPIMFGWRAGDVPRARPHAQFASFGPVHFDSYRAIARCIVRRTVGERVAAPNVVRDPLEDLRGVFGIVRKEGLASGGFRQFLEHLWLGVRIVLVLHADCINDCVHSQCKVQNVVEGRSARVVPAVADDNQHFLLLVPLIQVLQRGTDGIE